MRRSTAAYQTALAAAWLTAACGSDHSPVGPDVTVPAGVTINGTLVGAGASSTFESVAALASKGGIRVTVTGTALSAHTSPSGEFSITGVPEGTATLHFEGQGCNADLTLSGLASGQTVTIKVNVSGKKAKLVSGDDPGDDGGKDDGDKEPPPDDSYSFSGVINTVDLPELCVDDLTVVTNAKTVVLNALGNKKPLSILKAGQSVYVEGKKKAAATNNGGSYKIVATKIKLKKACSSSVVEGQPNDC